MSLETSILMTLSTLALMVTGALPLFIIRKTFSWMESRKKHRNPLNEKLLRLPGKTTKKKLDAVQYDLDDNVTAFVFIPVIICAMVFSRFYVLNDATALDTSNFITSVGAIIPIFGYLAFKDIKLLRKRRELTLQLDCEVAVSQELNQLMREGYYIYHNFPAQDFNIDHIVIGPLGVFAIETLGRNKPLTDNNKKQATVIYNGDSLKFPTWTETQPLEQINAHAEWLANWLKEVEGISIKIIPVLTLPGWFIDSKEEKYPTRVFNPKFLLGKIKAHSGNLSPELMKRIANQVEARCRETEEVK